MGGAAAMARALDQQPSRLGTISSVPRRRLCSAIIL
jgi:hypothetical protein